MSREHPARHEPLRILMVCAELAPLAKSGGLADVTSGLSRALAAHGHDVRVLLPRYRDDRLRERRRFELDEDGITHRYVELEGTPHTYLLDGPAMRLDDGAIYAGDERDADRFLRLCEGALRLTFEWRPHVVHCHDWHCALTPGLLRARRSAGRTGNGAPVSVLTLHNAGYQGVFADRVVLKGARADLRTLFDPADLAHSRVNLLKAGVAHADALTTVSPTYAKEIQQPEFGADLAPLLAARSADLVGILNGVDYETWSPERDPYIGHRYDATDRAPKRQVKKELCDALGLRMAPNAPLLGVVSRLVVQKGIDLVMEAIPTLLERSDAAFVLLGAGDPDLVQGLTALAARHSKRVSFTAGHDEALAHRIIAASDLLLIPSRYEPCGLTQLYAMRYGTVPVVRATGGLADTVQHFDPATGNGNGSRFEHADAQGLLWAVGQALAWYAEPALWRRLMDNGMRADFSWQRQVGEYERLYRRLLAGRPVESR